MSESTFFGYNEETEKINILYVSDREGEDELQINVVLCRRVRQCITAMLRVEHAS